MTGLYPRSRWTSFGGVEAMDRYKSMPRARARQAIPGATKATSVAGVRWSSRVIAALLALVMTAAVVVIAPGVATASTIAPTATWTEQNPATSPPARSFASMAFDPATGTMVLFGGDGSSSGLSDTWTWNGTTWTKQSPTTSPPASGGASMAYDPATGSMVLFGGYNGSSGYFADTWTWNGTTWTQQSPATIPPAREDASMAYDPATGSTVLFGGQGSGGVLADTWTYGFPSGVTTNWTEQSPATGPSARATASMAFDPATGTAVLFGGDNFNGSLYSDTWTWNGTTWTKQSPTTSPSARYGASMAYDPAAGTMVLFGGIDSSGTALSDTWTWDWNSTGIRIHPTRRPGPLGSGVRRVPGLSTRPTTVLSVVWYTAPCLATWSIGLGLGEWVEFRGRFSTLVRCPLGINDGQQVMFTVRRLPTIGCSARASR